MQNGVHIIGGPRRVKSLIHIFSELLHSRMSIQSLHFVLAEVVSKELQPNHTHLIKQVVIVVVILVQNQLEKGAMNLHVDRFELARLEPALFVWIEGKVA